MTQINFALLAEICEKPGAPGHENQIRNFLIDQIKDTNHMHSIDGMGNLIVKIEGRTNQKLMLAAHMDEISFIVNYIDNNGFLKFQPLGGFDPKTLSAQRVIIHGKEDIIGVMGSKPIHIMTADEKSKTLKLDDFFIDTGLSAEKVKSIVSIGDVVTRERKTIKMGDCINGKSLDNRVSVYILLEIIKRLSKNKPACDTYCVFTVQEEVGIRGATAAVHAINPNYGLAIDTTIAFDLPGALPQERCTELGKGTAIKIMDAMTICDQRMVKFLKERADKSRIKWQPEVMVAGGTDTAALQRYSNEGCIVGAISIPTRHLHQVIEMVHSEDVVASIELLEDACMNLDDFNWDL